MKTTMKEMIKTLAARVSQALEAISNSLPLNPAGRRALAVLAVLLCSVAGFALQSGIRAATPTGSLEAEAGTSSSCASIVSDTSASGSSAIKFGGGCSVASGLDETGATIPDTNYAVPAGAIFMATSGSDSNSGLQSSPVATLAKAITLVPTNGTIVVRAGTYRDGINANTTAVFTIQPYPHEQVWFDGANIVSGWTSSGGQWYVDWTTSKFCNYHYYDAPYDGQGTAGPCTYSDEYNDPANPAAGDPQMVFKDGAYVHEVNSKAAAVGDNFYYDWTNQRLYIGFDPTSHTVELAQRPNALVFQAGAGGNVVRGLGFKRYATSEYGGNTGGGAIAVVAPNVTLENDVFKQAAGNGLLIADSTNAVVRSSVFVNNGANGITGNGHQHSNGATDGIVIDGNVFNGNNSERFGTGCSASCSAAGIKLAHIDGFTLKNNIFENGVIAKGFWCDLACSDGVMVNNVFKNNGGAGLMYEVSDTGIIASNLIYGNGAQGIKLGSANTKVYNNTIVNNGVNVLIYDDDRTYGVGGWTDVGPDTTNVSFANNITYGGNTMMQAWRTSASSPNTGPDTFFSLLDNNSYYRTGGGSQVLYSWKEGASLNTTNYLSVAALISAKNLDVHSLDKTDGSNPFVNLAGSDYNLSNLSVDRTNGAAIPADVASALGVSQAAGQSRGAFSWPGR